MSVPHQLSAITVRRRFHNQELYAGYSIVYVRFIDDTKVHVYIGNVRTIPGQTSMDFSTVQRRDVICFGNG